MLSMGFLIVLELSPLEFKPQVYCEDYWSYALCNHLARIHYNTVRWPGLVHDNRVWTTSNIFWSRTVTFQ